MATEKPPLTPQEKKALSYSKDRRNTYGQNAKAARRRIPLRKAAAIRAARHGDKVAIATAEVDEVALLPPRRGWWKKSPDEALGKVLARKRAWRDALNKRAESTAKSKGNVDTPE
ncbi:MAG: hypothetical protein RLZZ437_870 [Pseudomonadota bacterium]|jgi:hypothetical protein